MQEVPARSVKGHRIARMVKIFVLLLMVIFLQAFLLIEIKRYVTPPAVWTIRRAYSIYEEHMYSETTVNEHGDHRGVEGTFDASRFDDMDKEDQDIACHIPLSRPYFFGTVLLIWTVCIFKDLKVTYGLFKSLILETGSCNTMKDAVTCVQPTSGTPQRYLVHKLPFRVKAAILTLIILPRAGIAVRVLWVGCRWLLATTRFGDLVLNAVALEFVVAIRELVFEAVTSEQSKRELQYTKICREDPKWHADWASLTGSMIWGVLAIGWVLFYMGIPRVTQGSQKVLPDYRWDVHHICSKWYVFHYCVDEPCEFHSLLYYLFVID
jgi:hypothetical protein